jgi:ribonuclease HI
MQNGRRRTRLINIYDNRIGLGTCYLGDSERTWRAIEDLQWQSLLRGRAVLLGDFNAHSPTWNPLIAQKRDAESLERIIEEFDLILNNEEGAITRPGKGNKGTIIDLAFTTTELGPLDSWAIDEDNPTPSDHAVILLEWAELTESPITYKGRMKEDITGWNIDGLKQDPDALAKAKEDYLSYVINRPLVDSNSLQQHLEEEAAWIEESLVQTLNKHAKPIRITAYSKRWWNQEVQEARTRYARARRSYKLNRNKTEVKVARNSFYITLRKAKRLCWQNFLQEDLEDNPTENQRRCWTALKYTSPRALSTTPAVKGNNGEVAITLEQKEELFLESQFPRVETSDIPESTIPQTGGLELFTDQVIRDALFSLSTKKAPGPDRLNFKAIRLLWEWDQDRVLALLKQCFRVGYHPKRWKIARGILLRKPNKPDYTIAKHYRIICLLNCLGKLAEKAAAEILSKMCEQTGLLHRGQFGSRKRRGAIDAVTKLIAAVEQAWKNKKIAGTLFLDIKGAFPNVIRQQLVQRLVQIKIPGDIIRWVDSFFTDRKIQLVIDGYTCPAKEVEAGLPQGSPISPILFAIYISGFFEHIEESHPIATLSFADDIGIIAVGSSVRDITKILEAAGLEAIQWGLLNKIGFEVDKTEAVLFTRKRKLAKQIKQAKIRLKNKSISFNKEATRWLGIWLDSGLSFKTHYQTRLQKAKAAESRLKAISGTHGLSPGLVRRVQIAVVQSIALYGAEIWWQGQKTWAEDIQRLINRQARAITGALRTTPIGPLIKEAALTPAVPLLEDRQRRYALRALKLPAGNPINDLLPATIRHGDGEAQPGQYAHEDLDWSRPEKRPKDLGQRLARKLTQGPTIDPAEGCEMARPPKDKTFPGTIIIKPKKTAEEEAKNIYRSDRTNSDLIIWSDGSKLDTERVGTGIALKQGKAWIQRGYPLGKTKEVFDAELYGLKKALEIAAGRQARNPRIKRLVVLSDSQAALKRAATDRLGPGQAIALDIRAQAQALMDNGVEVTLQWVPSHIGIDGNEKADEAAKEAAKNPSVPEAERYSSFSYISRKIRAQKQSETMDWLYKTTYKGGNKKRNRAYSLSGLSKPDPLVSSAAKPVAKRFYQLKMGHAITASYLCRIKKSSSQKCWWCNAAKQDIEHLFFECRRWTRERQTLYSDLAREKIDRPRMSEDRPKNRLFNTPKAVKPLLVFLEATEIGRRPNEMVEEEAANRRLDEWELDRLEKEEMENGEEEEDTDQCKD